jgi:hypothetical protein
MNTSVHEIRASSFNCFYGINDENAAFRAAMYGSGRPICAGAQSLFHRTFQRVSAAMAAAAVAGLGASIIALAAIT